MFRPEHDRVINDPTHDVFCESLVNSNVRRPSMRPCDSHIAAHLIRIFVRITLLYRLLPQHSRLCVKI
jgi:hypothetical protein